MPTKRAPSAKAAEPHLDLTVQYASRMAELPGPRKLRAWARAALLDNVEVTLRIVGAVAARELNRTYRGKDYATNVLSFSYSAAPVSGDVVLCAPVLRTEARARGISLDAHCAHLVVHGLLHLQGFDHEHPREARRMERLETEIVTRLGYADPYAC